MPDKEYDNLSIIAEIARMYYEKNIPQNEIANRMFFSKSKVSRILNKAKELGIVEIKINYPIERIYSLENEIKQLFNLNEVIIIRNYPEHNNGDIRLERLGKCAADYIDSKLVDGDKVGLSWGRTLGYTIRQLKPKEKKDISVIQMMGAPADNYDDQLNSMNLVRTMSELYGGKNLFLYAPLFVENNLVKKSLMKEKIIIKTLNEAKNVDYLITGIADFSLGANSWAGYLDEQRVNELRKRGVVGFICGHLIDKNGRGTFGEEEDNIIGVSLQDIKSIPNVIAVAGGLDKVKAILAALNGGYINCLITDEFIGEKLIQLKK
ncbi:MAG: sugar-binding transcriptional regulator [Anaerorhabdus sp.]|uniref:sugar-binding transcriptional regulator n=1 Tax=Anaerorhabdus sp. TaxID=1872524 RepID=UPI003A83A6DF